jgi:hypothetical protein
MDHDNLTPRPTARHGVSGTVLIWAGVSLLMSVVWLMVKATG